MTAGRWTLPAVIFICALCWVLTYFLFPDSIASTTPKDSSSFLQSTRDLLLPGWAERIVSFLVYAIIGYFLIELNNQFSIIRMRASMQTAIYFLLVTVCPGMHLLYIGDIVALGSLISIYFLFKSYQQAQAAGYLFYSFFFIGAGSILFPQLTILSVLWLLEAYRFQSLTPRSFCGALLGWMLPYWMLFGHAFFYNEMELFYRPFNQLLAFGEVFNLQILQPWELAILGYLLVMFIVSAVHCIAAGFEDKIRTRAYLQFLIDLTLFLFLLIALQPIYCSALLPLLIISNSILIGHFFVLTIQLLIEWGLPGLFISALLAGSIVPFSSELVLVALVKLGLPPIACLIAATLGNTVGGMTCYYMGRLGKVSWIEKYFKVKKEKVDKMVKFLQGKGALMAFFTFLPAIGEVIAIALGFMRSNTWLTIVSMFVGKLIRYILLLYVLESAWDAMAG